MSEQTFFKTAVAIGGSAVTPEDLAAWKFEIRDFFGQVRQELDDLLRLHEPFRADRDGSPATEHKAAEPRREPRADESATERLGLLKRQLNARLDSRREDSANSREGEVQGESNHGPTNAAAGTR